MANELVNLKIIKEIIQRNWTDIININLFVKKIINDCDYNNFKEIKQSEIVKKQLKMSVTSVDIKNNAFLICTEYTIPKGNGVLIGTNIYELKLNGELNLVEIYGSHVIN